MREVMRAPSAVIPSSDDFEFDSDGRMSFGRAPDDRAVIVTSGRAVHEAARGGVGSAARNRRRRCGHAICHEAKLGWPFRFGKSHCLRGTGIWVPVAETRSKRQPAMGNLLVESLP